MNKFFTILMVFVLVIGLSPVYAQEAEEDEGGVSPDSVLYGLDRAAERLSYLLTIGKAAKAKKGLEQARERVLEAKKLVKEGNLENLDKIKEEHRKSIEKVKENLDQVKEESPEGALEDEIEVEAELEEQMTELEKAESDFDLKVSGTLTDEQHAKLKAFLDSLNSDISEVRVKVKDDKARIKVRIRDELNKSDKEIDDKEDELEREHKLNEVKTENAQKAVERLENKLEKLTEITNNHKARGRNVILMETRLSETKILIGEIKTKLENNELDGLRDLIKKADQLLSFSEVFRALEKNNDTILEKLESQRESKTAEINEKLRELKTERAERELKVKDREGSDDEDETEDEVERQA